MVGTVVGATVSGRVMLYFTHYQRLPKIGLTIAILAVTYMAFGSLSLNFVALEAMLALISLGLGTLLPITTVTVQNAVAPHQLGTATGSMNFFRNLGSALIVSIFAVLLLGGESQIKGRALDAVVQAGDFKAMFLAAAIGFGLSLVFISMQEERPLRGRSPKKAGS
jgi:sugar phosphate permease